DIYFNVPKNFDADKVVPAEGRTDWRQKITDGMHYMLHLLTPNPFEKKKQEQLELHGFIPLMASLLKKILGDDYKLILSLLLNAGVIETDGSYTVGSKSKSYRVAAAYMGQTKRLKLVSEGIKKRYKQFL